jgi:hypothetical protein
MNMNMVMIGEQKISEGYSCGLCNINIPKFAYRRWESHVGIAGTLVLLEPVNPGVILIHAVPYECQRV